MLKGRSIITRIKRENDRTMAEMNGRRVLVWLLVISAFFISLKFVAGIMEYRTAIKIINAEVEAFGGQGYGYRSKTIVATEAAE